MAPWVVVAFVDRQIYEAGGSNDGVAMIDKEHMRAGLLSSLDDGIALLQNVHSGVSAMNDFDIAYSTKLQLELAKYTAAVTELYLRTKHPTALVEPRLPDWDHWAKVLWSIYDAVALAANREPEREIDWEEPPPLFQWLEAAVQSGSLKPRFSATDFLQWFDRLGDENMVLPPALRQAVAKNWTNFSTGDHPSKPHRDGDHADTVPSRTEGSLADELGPRARDSVYRLLVHFMRTTRPVEIETKPDNGLPYVRPSEAARIEGHMQGKVKVDTVKTHLNNALERVWDMEQAAVKRRPKRN